MGHRYLSNMPQIFGVDQDYVQTYQAVEQYGNPPGRSVIPENGSNNYPVGNSMTGEIYCTSQRQSDGWPNEHFPSHLRLEGRHVQTGAPDQPYNHSSYLPAGQSHFLPSQNNSGHAYGGYYNGHRFNEFESGLPDPVMNTERGPFKRKSRGISMACDRGSMGNFYCAGSSSSSAQFHLEKANSNYPTHPSSCFSHGGGLSVGVDNHLRNVRSCPGLNIETNTHRPHLPGYPLHHYGSSSHVPNHSVRTELDLNANTANALGIPHTANRRFTYPGHNEFTCEMGPHLVGRSDAEISWHGSEPITGRNPVSAPHYPIVPHGHPVRDSSGHRLSSSLPPSRISLGYYQRGHEAAPLDNGQQFFSGPSTSRYTAPSSSGSWHSNQREGRSRITYERFQSLSDAVDAHESLRSEALMTVDRTYLYSSRNLYDQYREMRLDIDNMTYEDLLALEERIGNVNTGLSEDAMSRCLMETTHTALDKNHQELTCAICLEECQDKHEIGTLKNCGHFYHVSCIKKWLSMKNSCPVCKSPAAEDTE